MTFLEFLEYKNENIHEAFKESDLDKAINLIANLLSKETNTQIINLGTIDVIRGGKDFMTERERMEMEAKKESHEEK